MSPMAALPARRDQWRRGNGSLTAAVVRLFPYRRRDRAGLVYVFGQGGNGKSVFINVLTGIMGDYAATRTMDSLTVSKSDRHSNDIVMLHGARIATASETEQGRLWAEARIKQLTGGDAITARFMRQDNFTFKRTFKLLIVGNYMTRLRNVDDAIRGRFNIARFVHKRERPIGSLRQN